MEFSEKQIESIICQTDNSILRNRGLNIWGRKFRQVQLGQYGLADIITIDRVRDLEYNVTIYELKKDKISPSTFWQVLKYARGCKHIAENRRRVYKINIRMVLVGGELDMDGSFCYLSSVLSTHVALYLYKYSVDGITFNGEGWGLTNHGL